MGEQCCGSECACEDNNDSCCGGDCGCGHEETMSKEEQIKKLVEYKAALQEEITAVEGALKEINEKK